MRTLAANSARTLRRCALALLPLLAACGGSGVDPHTAPIVTKAAKAETKAAEPATDEALAGRYLEIKERFAALLPEDQAGPKRILAEAGPELRQIAETARDPHLRANASLLLGTLHEANNDPRSAISFYRQAVSLLPEDAAVRRVLAMALASDKQFAAALPEQKLVVADDPDDLEAWLLLGEVALKAGQKDTATEAYAAYEMRRKGLLDAITLKSADGTFPIPPDQRAGCARALIPARDNGTAIALLYALDIETDPPVRQALVEAMGTQRLAGYKLALETKLKTETAQEVKEAIVWALAEIQRDPLDSRPGPSPVDPNAPAGPAGQGATDMAPGTGPEGQGVKASPTAPAAAAAAPAAPAPAPAPASPPAAPAAPAAAPKPAAPAPAGAPAGGAAKAP
jgi:tetratricopeptide (TPR) repeat protein